MHGRIFEALKISPISQSGESSKKADLYLYLIFTRILVSAFAHGYKSCLRTNPKRPMGPFNTFRLEVSRIYLVGGFNPIEKY